jgi:hypothetical protein
MSKWHGWPPDIDEKDLDQNYINGTEWLLFADAVNCLSDNPKFPEPQDAIRKQLQSGLARSCAARLRIEIARISAFDLEDQEPWKYPHTVSHHRNNNGGGVTILDDVLIPAEFWTMLMFSKRDRPAWRGKMKIGHSAYLCDWEQNEVSRIRVRKTEWFPEDEPEPQFQYEIEYRTLVDVSIERAAIKRLSPSALQPSAVGRPQTESERATKYDWLGAFAHVAAVLCYDEVIENPNKHGTQAKIERIMAQWFLDGGDEQPSPARLKTQAKIIMGALRSKASEG